MGTQHHGGGGQDGTTTEAPRALLGVGGLSGLLLAACFFLPAVEACNRVAYPFEHPALAGPYVFGLVTGAIALFALAGRRVPRWLRVAHLVLVALQALVLGYGVHAAALEPRGLRGSALVLAGLFWPLALLTLRAYLPGRSPAWRTARATAGGGGLCLLWFAPFVPGALLGLWLSIAAAASLLVVGAAQELALVRARRRLPRPSVF